MTYASKCKYMLLVGNHTEESKKKKVRTLVKQTLPTEWEVSKTDPTSYEDVDNLPLPRVRKSFGLLNRISGLCLQRWLMGSVREHLCCVVEGRTA